jgi:hypothetical protein
LCTSLNDTQDIVVYIGFTFSCQRFFLSAEKINQWNLSVSLKWALEAGFVLPSSLIIVYKVFPAEEKMRNHSYRFALFLHSVKGSQSQFQGAHPETGSGSHF